MPLNGIYFQPEVFVCLLIKSTPGSYAASQWPLKPTLTALYELLIIFLGLGLNIFNKPIRLYVCVWHCCLCSVRPTQLLATGDQ